MKKKIGIIGLGKMGFRMAQRLIEQNYVPVVIDLNYEVVKDIEKQGAVGVNSMEEMARNLPDPKRVLFSIPAGKGIDKTIEELIPYLSNKDIIIESGNSFYKDSQRRAAYLKEKGIYFLDAGISGGLRGAREGACIMIGGDRYAFERTQYIFKALSKYGSYSYLGKSGAGHLVKGYHNLVEYGYLQALAEGLVSVDAVSKKEDMGILLEEICSIWNKGSIVEGRITRDAETALGNNPRLENISGSVYGQTHNEMEELLRIAGEHGIKVPSCESALNVRIASQKNPTLGGKIINATRKVFGGHEEWK